MSEREGIRLQKVLARAGLGSRRTCEELIAAGRVSIDGRPAILGSRIDPEHERVEIDGVQVPVDQSLVHYLLNKPLGVVTTAHDPQGRPTVVTLVPDTPRVFPVGRLDVDTGGLLVLTNDGDLAQLLAHPSHGVGKTYLVEVEGSPRPADVKRLRDGIDLDDGRTAPAQARVVDRTDTTTALEIVLHEGRTRQIRRMADAIGFPVRRLQRVAIGPLADPRLAPGEYRALTGAEVRSLYTAASRPPH